MSIVYVGSAVGDEHGSARGGEPGDQTGRELRIQEWYKNPKGWIVLRPKTDEIAYKIAEAMFNACSNKLIGYDQGQRNTLYEAASKVGFDPGKVTTPCECDCSSLVRVCVAFAGIKVSNFNTASEIKVLLATKKFDELTEEKYCNKPNYLLKGDILVTAV